LEGYRRALDDSGIPFDTELIFVQVERSPDMSEVVRKMMALENPPTAVFAYDDDMGAELMHELFEAGCTVPGDMSVVGFDDCWFSEYLRVPLTTIRIPQKEIAKALVEMLSKRMDGGRSVGAPSSTECRTFGGEFVVRASTGPPRGRGILQ